jgi:hypothetical protein
MCVDNTETLQEAKSLQSWTKISNAVLNAILNVWASAVKNREWLVDDYKLKWH